MAGIRLENVSKVYDHGKIGVQKFNLEVFEKEFVVLVGPSGCGKSTTLRLIAGLEQPSGGRIFIGDRLVNAVPPSERDIAMVFQNYALYPHMTVYENMAFGLKLQKLPKEEIHQRVTDAASLLEMEEYLDRKPKALSGGQRQRAALGRAIVRKPKVFLFDEPLSNLDAKMRLQMRTEISKLHHRLEATMIYVTHDQTEAMSLADRIVLMKDGWIQQIGTPLKLYNRPVNLFSAGFIGSPPMNFLEGTVEKKGRRIFINIGSGVSFPISVSCSARVAASGLKKIVAGFRPEDVNLQKGKKAPEEIQMKGTVEVVEQMGSETYLHFMLKQGKKHLVARIDADNEMKAGSEVLLSLDISKVHFFDPETEQVI